MIWYFGLTALFLLSKMARAFLPTALSVVSRPLFPFQQAQHAQVFVVKPAPSCKLFAGLGGTNKFAIFLLFSSYLTLVLSSRPCPLLHLSFYLKLCGRSGRNCDLSCSIRLQWVPGHSFFPRNDAADELARRRVLLAPSAIPCSLSPLISRIHSRLFLDWRRTVSSKFFDTQVPSISTEELVLHRHARCVLSRLRCNEHSVLLSFFISSGLAELRILPAALVVTRPGAPFISFCTVQMWTLCASRSLATLHLSTTSGPDPG